VILFFMPLLTIFPLAARWSDALRWLLRAVTGVIIAGASILLAAWLILQWGILPRIEQWKPELERWTSQALGVQVRSSAIEVSGGLWSPMLTLRDVRLIDSHGRTALQLSRVRAVLVPRSLLPRSLVDWAPHFEQILVEDPQLELRRDPQGRLWLAGMALTGPKDRADSSSAADWLFSQREIVVRGGDLRWVDEQRNAPPLHLQQVQLLLRNRITRHQLRLDATPPPGWGLPFTLQGDFRGSLLTVAGLQRSGDWQRWRGRAHANVPLVDIEQLDDYLPLPWQLQHGRASVQAWLDIDQGTVAGADADIALREVALHPSPQAQALEVAWLKTRLAYTFEKNSRRQQQHLGLQQLAFETRDGLRWPSSELSLDLEHDPQGQLRSGGFEASQMDLALLGRLADRVPLPTAWRQSLDSLQPSGQVAALRARWQGPIEQWQSYWASGQVRRLSLASGPAPAVSADSPPRPGRPGLHNANLDFELTERGGHAGLQIREGALDFPGIFEQSSVPIAELKAELSWRRQAREGHRPQYTLEVQDLRVANADLQGQFQATWQTGSGEGNGRGGYLPGVLDMKGRLSRGDVAQVHRYLPLVLGTATRGYLHDALLAGRVSSLSTLVRGDLHDFPFEANGSGDFKLHAQVEQARFEYVPAHGVAAANWPVFSELSTELSIDRHTLRLSRGSARLADNGSGRYTLTGVQGQIANYLHQPVLEIQGQGNGPLADALHYVNAAPVGAWIGHALAHTRANGEAALNLALHIPLTQAEHSTVRGTVQLAGNELSFAPDVPTLSGTRGQVNFSEHGFAVSNATTRTVGGLLSFEGGQQTDGSLRFTGTGLATAEGLRRTNEMPSLANLASQLSGQAPYRLQLGFVHGQTELLVTSPLTGMAVRLPAPLGKTETEALPLRVSVQPQAQAANGDTTDLLRIELGKLLDAQYLRRHSSSAGTPIQVVRGAIGLGQSPEWPTAGVQAQLAWPAVSVDDWTRWAQRANNELNANGDAAHKDEANLYLPSRVRLHTAQLQVQGRRLNQVRATVSKEPGSTPPRADAWHIEIDAEQLAGTLELQGPGFGMGSGALARQEDRVQARLSRLNIPRSEVSALGEKLEHSENELPALDVVIERLELHGQPLGRLELQAANQASAGAGEPRSWRIAKLLLASPEFQLQASGLWSRRNGNLPSQTSVDFKLDIQDAGQLLARLGLDKAVRNGTGALSGEVRWHGSPLAFDWASLGGQVHLGVDRGQFLRADAGAAKLLGILSLQSLPRRLLLDFRDLTQSGFPFDRVEGDLQIERGVARTHNLRVRGVQALILTEGSADLVNETQDLQVWVVPEINAGAASLAYAVVNPAIGLGTLLGQLFLRKPLAEAATREFHVTGPWGAPQVTAVERSPTPPDVPEPARPAAEAKARDNGQPTP